MQYIALLIVIGLMCLFCSAVCLCSRKWDKQEQSKWDKQVKSKPVQKYPSEPVHYGIQGVCNECNYKHICKRTYVNYSFCSNCDDLKGKFRLSGREMD